MATAVSSVFGNITIASQLEEAVIDTLQYWFPTYLAEIARQLGISPNSLPHPVNYTNRNSFDSEIGEQIPKVVVIAPGLFNPPIHDGVGLYRASWRIGVGVATAAKDEQSSNMRVKAYAGAVRAILLQNMDLGLGESPSFSVVEIVWVDESYDDLPIPNQLMLYKASASWFVVDVNNVVKRWGGPDEPTVKAPPAYTTVEKVIIDVSIK
jgi:hypothetical protein